MSSSKSIARAALQCLRTAPRRTCLRSTPALILAQSSHIHSIASQSSRPPQTTSPRTSKIPTRRHASTSTSPTSIRRTALYDFHVSKGGKMVPFAGYSMPVQYTDMGLSASHIWTRTKASIFDVSHMVQHTFSGPGAADLLAKITPCAPHLIIPFNAGLSALLNEEGGIIDDTIVTNVTEKSDEHQRFYVVTNAGCRDKDLAFLDKEIKAWNSAHADKKVEHEVLETNGLVALQGPLAAEILASLPDTIDAKTGKSLDVQTLYFGQSAYIDFGEIKRCLVSRGGYTGEDGFEISIPQGSGSEHQVIAFTQKLLDAGGEDKIRMAGLGARDSLRLEAGMCLYGHDIDETTTPVEAGLSWIVTKERRKAGGFHGAEKILAQLKPVKEGGQGPPRRRVGFTINDPAPAREGAEIQNAQGKVIGKITSGGPSPSLGKNIAMGYVESGFHKAGTELSVVVRKKKRPAVVTKMPFVDAKYWRAPAEKKA